MKEVISIQELEEMLRNRAPARSQPWDTSPVPSARDLLRNYQPPGHQKGPKSESIQPSSSAKAVNARSSQADLEAFFHSPPIHALKLQICDIGRRMWQRAYVDGNGGNIAIRVGEGLALCTPTAVSKGFMKPEDLCLVDLEGNQLAGTSSARAKS
jgi:L-fuculose-phosphate aldolase